MLCCETHVDAIRINRQLTVRETLDHLPVVHQKMDAFLDTARETMFSHW